MSLFASPTAPPAPDVDPRRGRTAATVFLTLAGLFIGLRATYRQIHITDFPIDMAIYRDGVRAFMSGGEMYSVPMHAGDVALPFIYPPFGALVLVPLTAPDFLTDDDAGNIMLVVSNLLILLCLYLVFRALVPSAPKDLVAMAAAIIWGVVLFFEPVELNNGFAQINIVLMALVVLDLVPRERRFLPQGTLIGVAAAIKLTPLAFGLYWLLRRDVRSIVTAAISAVTCTLVAALWRFDATVEFYFSTLLGMGSGSEIGVDTTYQSNSSLKGMIMRFSPDAGWLDAHSTLVNVVWLVLAAATVVLGAWLMLALIRRGMLIDAVLVNAVVMLLVSPVSWSHHWVWLTLVIPVFAWRAATYLNHPWAAGLIVAVWTALLVTNPPKWWFGDEIDVFALSLTQKILVSDFVWLGVALLIAVAVGLRTTTAAPAEMASAAARS